MHFELAGKIDADLFAQGAAGCLPELPVEAYFAATVLVEFLRLLFIFRRVAGGSIGLRLSLGELPGSTGLVFPAKAPGQPCSSLSLDAQARNASTKATR
jgi:hypothetical protein